MKRVGRGVVQLATVRSRQLIVLSLSLMQRIMTNDVITLLTVKAKH